MSNRIMPGSPLSTLLLLDSVLTPKVKKPLLLAAAKGGGAELLAAGPGDVFDGSMALLPHLLPNLIPTAQGEDSMRRGE